MGGGTASRVDPASCSPLLAEGLNGAASEEAASGVGGMSPYSREAEASGAASASSGAGASLSPTLRNCAESWGFYLGRVVRLFSWCCISPSGGRPLWPMSATVCMRSSILMSPCSFPALPA